MKTLAIRLEDDVHAQLTMVAQLSGTTVTDEIRQAIEGHIARKRAEGNLAERASQMLDEIEQEAAARKGAIQALLAQAESPSPPKGRRSTSGSSS
jgi:hypothetical protein